MPYNKLATTFQKYAKILLCNKSMFCFKLLASHCPCFYVGLYLVDYSYPDWSPPMFHKSNSANQFHLNCPWGFGDDSSPGQFVPPNARPKGCSSHGLFVPLSYRFIGIQNLTNIIITIINNQGTNARRCPMPLSLFDAIFDFPKQRGIVLVLMRHTSLLYCPSILYVAALFC